MAGGHIGLLWEDGRVRIVPNVGGKRKQFFASSTDLGLFLDQRYFRNVVCAIQHKFHEHKFKPCSLVWKSGSVVFYIQSQTVGINYLSEQSTHTADCLKTHQGLYSRLWRHSKDPQEPLVILYVRMKVDYLLILNILALILPCMHWGGVNVQLLLGQRASLWIQQLRRENYQQMRYRCFVSIAFIKNSKSANQNGGIVLLVVVCNSVNCENKANYPEKTTAVCVLLFGN